MTFGAANQQIRGNNPEYRVRLFWNSNDFASESSGNAAFFLTTQNVPLNTTLWWEFVGVVGPAGYTSPASSADFLVSSGSFTHTGNVLSNILESNLIDGSSTQVDFRVLEDSLTEGGEAFQINIRTGSNVGPIVATSNILKILDFSTAPVTYAITPAASSVNEGSSLTFNIATTSVNDGTILYWTLNNSTDFSVSFGSVIINSNTASFSVTPTADTTTEGAETFIAYLRTTSTSGTIVATSSSVTINDTSQTPAPTITTRTDANAANLRLAIPFSTTTTTDDVAYLVSGSPNTAKLTPFEAAGGSIVTNNFKFYNSSYQPATSGIGYTLPAAINTSSTFLIEFWARTTSSNTNNWIFSNDYNAAREWTIGLNIGGSMPTSLTPNAGNGRIGGITSGTWNHFAFSEGSWWFNGTRRGSCNWGGTGFSTLNIWVGRQKDFTIFDGQINDFRIYIGTNKYGTSNFTVPLSILQ
jgi:hypothetical protein